MTIDDNERQIALEELRLESQSMEQSERMLKDMISDFTPNIKFIFYIFNTLGFCGVCIFAILRKDNEHQDNLFFLLMLLPFTHFISEKKLLHDVFEAIIDLAIALIKLPQNGTNAIIKYVNKE